MSLILDALRKSEAERRRGQAPDLYAELPPLVTRPVTRTPVWPWWLAGGLAVLVALWGVRDLRSPGAAVAASDAAAPAAATREPIDSTSVSRPATPPSAYPTPASLTAPAAATAPARSTAARSTTTIESAAPTPTTAGAATATVVASSIAVPAPASATPEPAPPPPSPAPAPPTAPVVASASPTAVPANPTARPALMRLADLPAGEREQLPALKISMHMWGPTPGQRFAIIDGTRVSQGDRVGEAVVEEIAADSVILNFHGDRVALPIR